MVQVFALCCRFGVYGLPILPLRLHSLFMVSCDLSASHKIMADLYRDYFIATGVLFAGSWLHRQIRIYFEHGIHHRAEVSLAANGFVRVGVPHENQTASWPALLRQISIARHACLDNSPVHNM